MITTLPKQENIIHKGANESVRKRVKIKLICSHTPTVNPWWNEIFRELPSIYFCNATHVSKPDISITSFWYVPWEAMRTIVAFVR
jgi:hypothetical protein